MRYISEKRALTHMSDNARFLTGFLHPVILVELLKPELSAQSTPTSRQENHLS